MEVTFRAYHDEADVGSLRAASQLQPQAGARPFEVGEADGVVDVTKRVDIAKDHLPGDHVPPTLPALLTHASLYRRAARGNRQRAPRARLEVATRQWVIEIRRHDRGGGHQAIEIHACLQPHPIEHVHQILGGQVA